MGEIRRTRALLGAYVAVPLARKTSLIHVRTANNANSDWINGEKTEDIVAFLDRLYTAKRKVEKRIVLLGGEADSVGRVTFNRSCSENDTLCSEQRSTRRHQLRPP